MPGAMNRVKLDEDAAYAHDVLAELREGRMLAEVGRALRDVVAGVRETAAAGTVTITLRVAYQKDSNVVIETVDKVDKKVPEVRVDAFYIDPRDRLTRRYASDDSPALFKVDEGDNGATVLHIAVDDDRTPYRDD